MNGPECPSKPPHLKLSDLAQHLTSFSGTEVTEERILELILDDKESRLTLSVIFPDNTMAICCHEVYRKKADLDDDIAKRTFPSQFMRIDVPYGKKEQLKDSIIDSYNIGLKLGDDAFISPAYSDHWFYLDQLEKSMLVMAIEGLRIGADRYLIEDKYDPVWPGVWDLPMIGNEWLEVKRQYHNLLGGATVSKEQYGRWTGGVCLKGLDGRIFKLQVISDKDIEHHNFVRLEKLKQQIASFNLEDDIEEGYYKDVEQRMKDWSEYFDIESTHKQKYCPMDYLPEGIVLVVRAAVLKEFENLMCGNQIQKIPETQAVRPIVKRVTPFNECIALVVAEFTYSNNYEPTTVEEIMNRMRKSPHEELIIDFQGKLVHINNSAAGKTIVNLERAIKRYLGKRKMDLINHK